MNDSGITYPVDPTIPEWSVWDEVVQEITRRDQRWPRSDGLALSQSASTWWLRQVTNPPPPYNQHTQELVPVPDQIDKPANELRTTWNVVELEPDEARQNLAQTLRNQVPRFDDLQKLEDRTREAQTAQGHSRWQAAVEIIDATPDIDLGAVSAMLDDYEIPEAAYAANLVEQESNLLAEDSRLKIAGDEGLLSAAEVTDIETRVAANSPVARGKATGVQEPTTGAARGFVTLDSETAVGSLFEEISFEWNTTPYYIPRVVLDEIPAGVNASQVYAMIYDAGNVYRSWMPFAQRGDGKWETPSNVSYIAIAKSASATWRVAVSYQGTDAASEITQRIILVPPNTAWSKVRWGGRTISAASVRVR